MECGRDDIIYPFLNFSGKAVDAWKAWKVILSYILLGMWLLIYTGIKFNHYSEKNGVKSKYSTW